MAKEATPEAEAKESPKAVLLAEDIALLLQVFPRAQIVVGDMPRLYPVLARLEQAARTGRTFVELTP